MEPTASVVPNILIADDDLFNLELLKRILQREYQVTTVRSGELALEALARNRYQLVILDVMMGMVDGYDVLEAIRQMPDGATLPVIMISALAQSQDIIRGLQLGANDYITKPFDIDVVRARVAHQLNIKQALDERQAVIAYLKEAHEMKDHFLRIATHDLKSPLNNILLAQYYLRELVGADPQAAKALDAIEETVNWMSSLVEDFLDTSMLKSGSAELRLEAVTAEDVIWDVVDQYSATANRKDITVLFGTTDGVVLADRNRLTQILSNLVSNALKYSPPNRFVTVSSVVIGDRVRFNVADEGPGITPDEQKRLFKAFGKLSTRPTGGESSSGLGLWIVKELVELQNGQVGVDCPPDGGSTFWFELPQAAVSSEDSR
ncbi:MAG: hybrid sensor histidine kinase/response regulator [Chloroflexi bacterium]|nr:hybrid sensor histidine kinase/response regulator [Chloroflexota bacterium]